MDLPPHFRTKFKKPYALAPQHFLYFLPEPQGHGSFPPILAVLRASATAIALSRDGPESLIYGLGARIRGASSVDCTCVRKRYWTISSSIRFIIASNNSNDSFLYSTSGSRCPYPRNPIPSLR